MPDVTIERVRIRRMDSITTRVESRPKEHADHVTMVDVTVVEFGGRVFECDRWRQHGGECIDMDTFRTVVLEVE